MPIPHEEYKPFAASALAMLNYMGDQIGFTAHASDTTVAGWQQTNLTQFGLLHEDTKHGAVVINRLEDNLAALGIYGATEIAASNDQATTRAQITAQDPNLPADLHGSRSRP